MYINRRHEDQKEGDDIPTMHAFRGAAAHLGRGPVLLHGGRLGAGVGVVGGRVHIVVAEAAEECAEDAPAPLLLQAAVGLGRCGNSRRGGGGQRVNKAGVNKDNGAAKTRKRLLLLICMPSKWMLLE